MSISDCRHCKRPYWRYRRDFPPAGYCSLPHSELGPAKKKHELPPRKPDAVLFEYRAHRISEHRDRHFLQDYECDECERMQGEYAESMNYWIDHPVWSGGSAPVKSGISN